MAQQQYHKYVNCLATYLRVTYDTNLATRMLLRLFLIEKTIKKCNFDTIGTKEFFFMLYFIFRHVSEFTKHMALAPMDILRLSDYLCYSFCGPAVEYKFRAFNQNAEPTIKWNEIMVDIVLRSSLPHKLNRLNTDKEYYDKQL